MEEFEISRNGSTSTFIVTDERITRNISAPVIIPRRKFVERHLFIENKDFLIAPNGGTGDCAFKAIAQAIKGSEVDHHKIREEVVNFVVNHRWDKFKVSIEVQHVHGNRFLQKSWPSDPIETYQDYMNTSGTLGSSTELNAAGELFHFNFVTIQEYSDMEKKTYRIENCCPFDDPSAPFHYFYFTGDFDNGHWEYLDPLTESPTSETIPDGMYPGLVKVLIDGSETSVEEWLKIHTHNTNDESLMEHTGTRYLSIESAHPFESEEYNYAPNGSVLLKGQPYRISDLPGTDLFTVLSAILSPDRDQADATLVDQLEDQIVHYRVGSNALLNYKLITQPQSHGFDIGTLKFVGMSSKGNVQDLLAAADLYGFSFEIFIKPETDGPTRSCRFVHVDRWGGEADRIIHFVMRLTTEKGPCPLEELVSKWWHVMPQSGNSESSFGMSNNNVDQFGDFVAVSENQNLNMTRPTSASGSSRRSSKHATSACGSGDDMDKESLEKKESLHFNSDSGEEEEEQDEAEEEDSSEETSITTNIAKTVSELSDSDSNSEQTNPGFQEEVKKTISSGSRKKSVVFKESENNIREEIEEDKNCYHLAKEKSEIFTKKSSTIIGLSPEKWQITGQTNHENVKENVMPKNEERFENNPQILMAGFLTEETPVLEEEEEAQPSRKSRSDEFAMRRTKNGRFISNPSRKPRVQTQVYIYDEVTDKKREFRFEGVKTREQVLRKLLKRGYIKKIPVGSEKVSKSTNYESDPSFTERVEMSVTRLDKDLENANQSTGKRGSGIMKVAKKYNKENAQSKSVTKWSFKRSNPCPKNTSSYNSSNGSRGQISVKFSCDNVSSQDVSNKNYMEQIQFDREPKESYMNLQLPRPKSASALAISDQESVERNNKFLAMHTRVSPWSQRKAERIVKSKKKNFLQRFISWIVSFFKRWRKTKVAAAKGKNVQWSDT